MKYITPGSPCFSEYYYNILINRDTLLCQCDHINTYLKRKTLDKYNVN